MYLVLINNRTFSAFPPDPRWIGTMGWGIDNNDVRVMTKEELNEFLKTNPVIPCRGVDEFRYPQRYTKNEYIVRIGMFILILKAIDDKLEIVIPEEHVEEVINRHVYHMVEE